MPEAVLGLGGNLGARRATFDAALMLLSAQPGCTLLARSRLYETPPLGPPQPDFLNAAVRVRWQGTAEQLLAHTQRIEAQLGRKRRERWGARTVDLDVLHWSEGPVRSPGLEIPHPELGARSFALAPLLEVAPELAVRWQHVLAQLGGAPPLAQPGWPALVREGAYLCGDWQHDEAELGSQLAALVGHALSGSQRAPGLRLRSEAARASSASAGRAPLGPDAPVVERCAESWGVQAFTGPGELVDEDGHSWLEKVVVAAIARGFTVRGAALVERDEACTAGVLVGFGQAREKAPSGRPEALAAALSVQLEQREGGQRRVKVRADASERGFDFNGSGTM